jgi:glycosyltransferase involved in cell wall biosynthesis
MRIVHVFRTPVGGLFRHVRDLVRGHQQLGHQSGIICDSLTGGDNAAALLKSVEPFCELGIARIPISRMPGLGDIRGATAVAGRLAKNKPDIVHCHGAKGGLYGRLAGRRISVPSIYTPHGGSLHYDWGMSPGSIYLAAEAYMRRVGNGLIFVCEHEKKLFDQKVGIGGKPFRIIYNGLWPEEVSEAPPAAGAADILYIGELRKLKGADILLQAIASVRRTLPVTALIVGDGEDRAEFEAMSKNLGLADCVTFAGAMPARDALPKGRLFVMPSRAESFPYAVLEACAASKPIVASNVGGIPEALPAASLVPPGDIAALTGAILRRLENPPLMAQEGRDNANRVANGFEAQRMCIETASFYRTFSRSGPAP